MRKTRRGLKWANEHETQQGKFRNEAKMRENGIEKVETELYTEIVEKFMGLFCLCVCARARA